MERGDNTTGMRRFGQWLAESFMADRSRWVLWAPVFMATGAALYFALPFEPSRQWAWLVVAGTAVMSVALHRLHPPVGWRLAAAACLLVACGFCAAKERTCRVDAPMLSAATGPVMVAGRVAEVDLADKGPRIVLDNPTIEGLAPGGTPRRIRLRLTRYAQTPAAGSFISVRAALMTPPGPAEPQAHDFRRDAYFEEIGGVGYAVGYPALLQPGGQRRDWLPALRLHIADRIDAILGRTPEAAIATAYLTGARGLIDEQTATDMRNSGLAHLLAISGMKVGLVAVLVFGATRLALALVPRLALRVPVRKIAACAGIAAAIAYTGLAAAPVPALRSVLMTSMAMLAILFDRQSFSLRLAAVAAMLVILVLPESATSVSFQMSFGAVVALIAFYEAFRHRIAAGYHHAGHLRRAVMDIGKIALTTFVATLVTAPLALFHFQQEANYSIPANAFAIPLNDFWIMPCGILALLLMPLHLDSWPLEAMGAGIRVMLQTAHWVSGWPGAVSHVPLLPPAVLGLASFGGLWIILWRRRWRRLGVAPIAAAIVLACCQTPPDILVSEDASHVAVRLADGTLALSRETRKDFTDENWDRSNGTRGTVMLPDIGETVDGSTHCDADGCLYRRNSYGVAILRDPAAAGDLCAMADIVISRWPMQVDCGAAQVIDPASTARTGATALYLEDTPPRMETAAETVGRRPWWISTAAKARPAGPGP
jgi:competence protein ComEC